MVFTPTPLDGSTPTPLPMASAVPDGSNTPLALEGGPSKTTGGNTLVPAATYQYDGYNVVEGLTTDAAVTGDNPGTLSAKLRGLSKIWNDVWDSVNHRIHVNVDNGNANGQATMVNSSPVVLPSDQTAIPVKRSTVALFSTTQTAQGSGNSGDLDMSLYTALSIDVNLTANAGTNPTIQFFWARKGISDGIYYPLWQSDLIQGLPANPTAISTSIGAGMEWPQFLGAKGRLSWIVGGTASPTYTFTPNVQAN